MKQLKYKEELIGKTIKATSFDKWGSINDLAAIIFTDDTYILMEVDSRGESVEIVESDWTGDLPVKKFIEQGDLYHVEFTLSDAMYKDGKWTAYFNGAKKMMPTKNVHLTTQSKGMALSIINENTVSSYKITPA